MCMGCQRALSKIVNLKGIKMTHPHLLDNFTIWLDCRGVDNKDLSIKNNSTRSVNIKLNVFITYKTLNVSSCAYGCMY